MTTIEEFQNFIKENNVLTPKDFKERFGDIYNEMKNLKLHQEVKYPTQPGLTKLVNTLEEFQQFIDENDIEKPSQLSNQFGAIYVKLSKLRLTNSVVYSNKERNYLKGFDTAEEFQRFIDENSVKSPKDLKERFSIHYYRLYELKMSSKVTYPNKKKSPKYLSKDYNTVEDFQKFINENNLSGGHEFYKKSGSIYRKFVSLGYQSLVIYPNSKSPDKFRNIEKYRNYGLKEIQEFIDNNGIKTPTELQKINSYLYKRISWLKLTDKIKWKNKLIKRDLSHLKTIEDFQNYIDSNNIQSYHQFRDKHYNVYKKYIILELRKTAVPLKFPDDNVDGKGFVFRSNWEKELARILTENGIEYEREVSFSDLRGKGEKSRPARFDFYLTEYNVLIEIQGPHHFFPYHEKLIDEKTQSVEHYLAKRYMDFKKHRYIQEHRKDCKILYYAHGKDGKYLVETYGYPYYVYTDIKLLLEEIKK